MSDRPPERLNEEHDPSVMFPDRLAAVSGLVGAVGADLGAGAIAITTVYDSLGNDAGIDVQITYPDVSSAQAGAEAFSLPGLSPQADGSIVQFVVPLSTAGVHGRGWVYSKRGCRGPLCRCAIYTYRRGLVAQQRAWMAAAPRVTKDDGSVVSLVDDGKRVREVQHGDYTTYAVWGCRCDSCTLANTVIHERYRPVTKPRRARTT